MVDYEELWGGKRSVVALPYKNQRQIGIIFKNGPRMDAYMVPIDAVKSTIKELQQAIEEIENVQSK